MKAPVSWLKKYISLGKDPQSVADILTTSGLEVDKIDRMHFAFSGVVIVHVLQALPHPTSDKLKIVEVTDGKKKIQVITSDLTIRPGIVTALAKVGAILKAADGEDLTIEKTKIGGLESYGMLVSKKELRLSDEHTSVIHFREDSPIGEDVATYLYDPTFDISLTPNLGHCRSILGIAKELSAHLQEKVHLPKIDLEESDVLTKSRLTVSNEAEDICFQYATRIIQGVDVGPSPLWLVDALEKVGYKSINNVVDVTNYVMHELGQPMHAFDYDKVNSKHIVIRKAKKGESITTLDGIQRTLPESSLIICDNKTPIAIGGVMGGKESSITDTTHTIILEAAHFIATSIRKTSKDLSLRSESSSRFENGIDPALVKYALDRAALLIQELGRGKILKGIIEESPKVSTPRFLTCRLSRVNDLLGTSLSLGEVESYLSRLGALVTSDGANLLQVKVPSHRNDIKEEIDLIEEVARIYGYNNIPKRKPRHITSTLSHHPLYLLERRLRTSLISLGLQEFITCDLISPELLDIEIEHGLFNQEYIKVLHAKSVDQSILRPSLLPGLLQAAKTNQNHGTFDLHAFEIGRAHFKEGSKYDETPVLGIILTGKMTPIHWQKKDELVDFYTLKGIIENIGESLLLPKITFEASTLKTFHPGRQAKLFFDKEVFAVMGQIHPTSLEKLGIRGDVYFVEMDLQALEKYRCKKAPFTPLPAFPGSERDWTVQIAKNEPMTNVFNVIDHLKFPLLKSVTLIDVYTGEKAGLNKKNVTFRFIYRDDTKTLDLASVEKEHQAVIQTLERAL